MCISRRKKKESSPNNGEISGGTGGGPIAKTLPPQVPRSPKVAGTTGTAAGTSKKDVKEGGEVKKTLSFGAHKGRTPPAAVDRSLTVSATQASASQRTATKMKTVEASKVDGELVTTQSEGADKKTREPSASEQDAIAPTQGDGPRELKAKRKVVGTREAKDPEYATLDDECPKFEVAVLKMDPKEKPSEKAPLISNREMETAKKKDG